MSRIELEQISENEVEVVLPPETPMEMVQQLTKGLAARGLIEDLAKSTVSVRYFKRPIDKANTVADELIKSLSRLAKDDELPYWHPKAQMANQRRIKDVEIGERRAKLGIKQPTNMSPAPEPGVVPAPATPAAPAAPVAPGVATVNTSPKMYDHTPTAQPTAGGTGKRYAYINDPVSQSEHVEGCQCDKCLDMAKSGYGPKGASQYNPADNARRKANNTGDQTGFGANTNTKAYTSAKFAGKDMQSSPAQKRPGPVKTMKDMSPDVVAQIKARHESKLTKSGWANHNPFPSAEEEIMRLAKNKPQDGEEAAAQQLANLMAGKSMLGENVPPQVKAMFAAPAPQPTDEQMFGGGVVTEDMAKAAEHKWNNSFNNWMQEAAKPITQRFASQAEEEVYWANIKVSDRDDGQSGF